MASKKGVSRREPNQKKKTSKGLKSLRGQGEYYDEVKKCVTVAITQTAKEGLDELSREFNISRSELIERIGRKAFNIRASNDSTPK